MDYSEILMRLPWVSGAEKVLKLVQEVVVENTYNMYEARVMQTQINSKRLSSDFSDPWVGGAKPSVAITVEEQRFHSQTGEKIVEDKSWGSKGAAILRRVMCGAMCGAMTDERLTYQVVEVDNGNNPEEIEGGGSYDVLPPAAVTVDRRRVEIRSPVLPIFSSFALF